MKANSLNKRLESLENNVPIIATLADYVLWMAHGRKPENVRWDPKFKEQMEKLFEGLEAREKEREVAEEEKRTKCIYSL